MAAKAASVLGRRTLWAATTVVLLALVSNVRAESLLDRAMDAPSSPAGGSSATVPNAVPAPQFPPVAPVSYKLPAPSSGAPVSGKMSTAPSGLLNSAPAAAPAVKSAAIAPGKSELKGDVAAVIHKLDPLRVFHERRFKIAAAEFPAFCQDWGRKLQERTQWGLSQINWHLDHGLESGTYTGYGPINSCTTKMSESGVAIGKLSYYEYVYSLSGKTIDEAKHAKPKQVSVMQTLEIFRFDHNKWFE
jgi:hypothetical protein